jgi:hypothetical protein
LEELSLSKVGLSRVSPDCGKRKMEMASGLKRVGKHAFSVELKSKKYLKLVAIPNDAGGNVLIEGFLGELVVVDLVEGVMLEILGTNGTLKMDLKEEELRKLLTKGGKRL